MYFLQEYGSTVLRKVYFMTVGVLHLIQVVVTPELQHLDIKWVEHRQTF